MKHDTVNYVVVGAFVSVTLAALFIVLFLLTGRGINLEPYFVEFSNVSGVSNGTPVTYEGFHVGQIQQITAKRSTGRTVYRVKLLINGEFKIPDDSIARVVQPGLLAANQIDIAEGKSQAYLEPGDTINGGHAGGILGLLEELSGHVQPLVSRLMQTLDRLDKNVLANMPDLADKISSLLSELNKSAANISSLTGGKNKHHMENLLANSDQFSAELVSASHDLKAASKRLDSITRTADELVTDSRGDIQTSVAEVRHTLEVISQSIDGIMYNMENTSRNMSEFSQQIRDNPSLLIRSESPQERQTR